MPEERKKLSKSDLREDEFVEWIMEATDYVRERSRAFIAGVVGLIAIVVLIQLVLKAEEENHIEAAKKLGQIWMAEEESRSEDAIRLGEEFIAR